MRSLQEDEGAFQKVGPCLYRYRNGTYYARFKSGGKEIRCSLETTDRKQAERNLAICRSERASDFLALALDARIINAVR